MADENTATTTELKPCPFCGGAAELYSAWYFRDVYCTVCGARTHLVHKTDDDAIAAWNRRVNNG